VAVLRVSRNGIGFNDQLVDAIRVERYAALFLSLALVAACARLPEYARPRRIHTDELQKTPSSGFAYRPLTPDDFRAASLPERMAEHAERIKANATIQIRLTADSIIRITSGDLNGQRYFFGTIEHLAFEAVMLPDRSWWNPKIPASKRRYVLQHEQIHFALTELTARQLTNDAPKWASDVLVIEPTAQRVRAELARQIKDRVNAAMEADLKRQTEFDEDTSLFFSPKRQQWWFRTVEQDLKQTHREPKDAGERVEGCCA
jgi:hypothetical protein